MSDFSHEQFTPEFAAIYQAITNAARAKRVDPAPILRGVHDMFMLEDRMEFADMATWLSEPIPAIVPTVGKIDGAEHAMFYRECTNMVFGPDASGKTMMMQAIIKQELEAGNHVGYLDFEELTPRLMAQRLQEMGIDPALGEKFHYMNVSRPASKSNINMIAQMITEQDWTLVVIDSVGPLLNTHGRDENKDGDVYEIMYERYGIPFAEAGAAVVFIDHTTKSSDGMASSGSKRKRAHVSGAAYHVDVEPGSEWSRDTQGTAVVRCRKDRLGTWRRNQAVAQMDVFPQGYSATGDLVIEFVPYLEVEDMIEDGMAASVAAHPSNEKPVPAMDAIGKAVMKVLAAETIPVQNGYIIQQLALRNMSVTKAQLELTMKGLAKDGWAVLVKPADTPARVSGWRVARIPSDV